VLRVVVLLLVSVENTLAHTRMNSRSCSTSKLTTREALGIVGSGSSEAAGSSTECSIHCLNPFLVHSSDYQASRPRVKSRTELSVVLKLGTRQKCQRTGHINTGFPHVSKNSVKQRSSTTVPQL